MIWFKACTRCNGDLWGETDEYGPYVACVRCGHYLTEAEEKQLHFSLSRQIVRSGIFVWDDKVAT